MSIPEDYNLNNYQYELDPERIAFRPAPQRTGSRLLILDRKSRNTSEDVFAGIAAHLEPGSLLVANNSRVLPARLLGRKETSGSVEFLLLTPLPLIKPHFNGSIYTARVECLLKASRRPRPGTWIDFGGGVRFRVLENLSMGKSVGELSWYGDLAGFFVRHGHVPLPPYIKREDGPEDFERYQTVYASVDKQGSVAAPTAGLHFTSGLKSRLQQNGFDWTEVCLYVGYGTFSPVKSRDVRKHAMHPEYIQVEPQAAEKINRARQQGRKVLAVGTTSVRTLESVYRSEGKIQSFQGWTDLFICPGFRFEVVDQLITNFHLPGSSLLLMVSALAGRERIMAAYEEAQKRGFRFYSYGDAMLIK